MHSLLHGGGPHSKETLSLFGATMVGRSPHSHLTRRQGSLSPRWSPQGARPSLQLLSHFAGGLRFSHKMGRGPRALSTKSPQTQRTELSLVHGLRSRNVLGPS